MTITFLQLSDLHLSPSGQLLAGVDPMRQMRGVLTRIQQLDVAPAFIVVSGDLTDNGSAESYEVVNEVLQELRAGETPVLYWRLATTTTGRPSAGLYWARNVSTRDRTTTAS